tara:strand:+ start:128 stop:379 length:252 start_codon:yes stop_codon:yes gene_type:complete
MNWKKIAKILIALGLFYWILLIAASLTGCKTNKDCSSCSSCNTCYIQEKSLQPEFTPYETTISLDPMDKSQWHEREEFLRHFE